MQQKSQRRFCRFCWMTWVVNDGCFRISEFFGHEKGVGFLDTVTDKDKLDETSCSN